MERVFQHDVEAILPGTVSRFTILATRAVGTAHAFLDLEHEVQGFRLPDGIRQTVKLHVAILAQREGEEWQWLGSRL